MSNEIIVLLIGMAVIFGGTLLINLIFWGLVG